MTHVREHLDTYPPGAAGLIFANEVGGALRCGLFRSRVWRPSLVRAGMLGSVSAEGDMFAASGSDDDGIPDHVLCRTKATAVKHVAWYQAGGLRFHDLRHSYATWLVDDGVAPTMVMRVMGHEKVATTLELYARRTDDAGRILQALSGDDAEER